MTFNDYRRWVFAIVANACAYAKLDRYFRKIQAGAIEVSQARGDFLGSQEARKVSKSKPIERETGCGILRK